MVVWPHVFWCLPEGCAVLSSRYALQLRWIWFFWIVAQRHRKSLLLFSLPVPPLFRKAYQWALWMLMIAPCSLSPEVLSRKSWERGSESTVTQNGAFEEKRPAKQGWRSVFIVLDNGWSTQTSICQRQTDERFVLELNCDLILFQSPSSLFYVVWLHSGTLWF